MPRMGKKTLYLDLDDCERLEAALQSLPGKPSLSSFLTDIIPRHTDSLERLIGYLERDGMRGASGLYLDLSTQLAGELAGLKDAMQRAEDVGHGSTPLSELMQMIEEQPSLLPPKKRRKSEEN